MGPIWIGPNCGPRSSFTFEVFHCLFVALLYKPNQGAVPGETGSAGRRGTSRSPSDHRMETDRRPPSSVVPPPPLFNATVEEAASRGSSSADPSLEVDVFADAPDDVSLQETKVAAVDPPELSEELRDRIVRQVRVPTFIFLALI